MVYYMGDIHGDPLPAAFVCRQMSMTSEDTLVLLGDVGANYYGDKRDLRTKRSLETLGPQVLCIHGNHEMRPENIASYSSKIWRGGLVWYEPEYPHLLFAADGEIFDLEGVRHLSIGGAYSVDKHYRLERGFGWWADEQPSDEIKAKVEQTLDQNDWKVDVVLSHTCPYRYEPHEAFLPFIDQSSVDDSTERWLDNIEEKLTYAHWFCGHWHIEKHIDKMHFLFHNVEPSPFALAWK